MPLNTSHPVMIDRALLRSRVRRATGLGPSTFLLDRVAEDFADRLAAVLRHFEVAVDLGTPTDAFRRVLRASGKADLVYGATEVVGDDEALPFGAGTLDLVVSGLALQFVNDLPGTLVQVRRAPQSRARYAWRRQSKSRLRHRRSWSGW